MDRPALPLTRQTLEEWAIGECQRLPEAVNAVTELVIRNMDEFVRWPERAQLLMDGCDRSVSYHRFPSEVVQLAKRNRVALDARTNGPALVSYLLAGGTRPVRFAHTYGWPIHHLYNGFPFRARRAHCTP
jgi:hypothetical protein